MTEGDDSSRVGEVVQGRYRILRRIGEGGMGAVYEAEHIELRRRVAIKCLHSHLASQKDAEARFRREALAATAIGNEHIIDVTDMGRFDDGAVFMVLEYLDGRDVAADLADRGPMTVGRAVHIATQICDALTVAHGKGIIHRDLKPENVFLVERHGDPDFVKVLDFGISKLTEALDGDTHTMTRTGTTVGTPYYMAPEQAQASKDIDHRADIYALGVILFRVLTGQHPFDDESYPMLVLKICTEAPPPVRRYRSDVPPELEQVVLRMLAKDPGDRYGSTAEVKEALAPFAAVHQAPQLTDAPGTRGHRAQALAGRVDSPLARADTALATPVDPEQEAEEVRELGRTAGVPSPGGGGDAMRWVLLGAAVLTVVLLGIFVLTMEGDERIDPEAELPDPKPPQTRALTAPGGEGIGWTWVNPLPRWMPTWYGVDVAAENLVALVGFGGGAARFDDGRMYYWPTGTDRSLYGVAWSGAREAIAVGDEGTLLVLRREGEPLVVDAGTDAALRDVVAVSPTEAWVVGDEGTLLRLDAYRPTVVESGTERDLLAIHRRGDSLWVVGEAGAMLRIEGGVVHEVQSGTEMTLRAVGGCASGDLYAAGDEGRLLRRDREGRWESVSVDGREPLASIACDGERAVVTGLRGGVLLVAGKRTVRLPTGTEAALHGVGSVRGRETWIVGEGGRLMKVVDDHLLTLTAGPTVPIRDMTTLSGALFAVGEWGRILRQADTGFEQMPSPTKAALAGVARHGDDRLLAVGDYGAVVEIEYEEARLLESPGGSSWRDVVSDGHAVLGVGTEGSVLRGVPGAFEVSRVGDVETLWALSGSPSSALAVGDGGAVVELTEAGARRIDCGVDDVGLRGVWRSPEASWAVGERGVVLRIEGSECVVERGPEDDAPTLNAVGRGPEGQPVAVGDDGVALDRADDGTWAPANLDVAGVDLRAVLHTSRDVFLAGEGGVIVRHIVLE